MDVLHKFLRHFNIQSDRQPRQVLGDVVAAFSRLPYENITKIIKHAKCGSPEKARRYAEEVIVDHILWGTGGTCFSLADALLHLVRDLGWNVEYILADRKYGQNSHCALKIEIDSVPHILDPGYLITEPIPLAFEEERELRIGANKYILTPDIEKQKLSLSTERRGTRTNRLTYKIAPADIAEYQKAWDASFYWEMMHYPLLVHIVDSQQKYLRGAMLQISNSESVSRRTIPMEELIAKISEEFCIHSSVVAQAIFILKSRGMLDGKTPRS
jgi:arylamine N-acetyltransferase